MGCLAPVNQQPWKITAGGLGGPSPAGRNPSCLAIPLALLPALASLAPSVRTGGRTADPSDAFPPFLPPPPLAGAGGVREFPPPGQPLSSGNALFQGSGSLPSLRSDRCGLGTRRGFTHVSSGREPARAARAGGVCGRRRRLLRAPGQPTLGAVLVLAWPDPSAPSPGQGCGWRLLPAACPLLPGLARAESELSAQAGHAASCRRGCQGSFSHATSAPGLPAGSHPPYLFGRERVTFMATI